MIALYSAGTPISFCSIFWFILIVWVAAFFSSSVASGFANISLAAKIFVCAFFIISASTSGVFLSSDDFNLLAVRSYSDASAPENRSSAKSPFSSLLANCAAWNVWKGSFAAIAAVWNILPCGDCDNKFKPNCVRNPGKADGVNLASSPLNLSMSVMNRSVVLRALSYSSVPSL